MVRVQKSPEKSTEGVENERAKRRRMLLGIFAIALLSLVVFFAGLQLGALALKKEEISENHSSQISASGFSPVEGQRMVNATIVARANDGQGVTAFLTTELKPGTGLVLVNINKILADLNTLYSARTAVNVAKNFTGENLDRFDIIFNIEADANIVAGQSAGATMAVSVIAAMLNKTLNPKVVLTGTIEPDGVVGDVGAVREKAAAARESGASLFLVPKNLGTATSTYSREKNCGLLGEKEFCQIRYVENKISLSDELGIEIREVGTIDDVVEHMVK